MAVVLGRLARRRTRPRRATEARRRARNVGRVIRPLEPGDRRRRRRRAHPRGLPDQGRRRSRAGASSRRRCRLARRHAGWVAIVDGVVAGRAEASPEVVLRQPAPPSPASACVAHSADEGSARASGSASRQHLDALAADAVTAMFVETAGRRRVRACARLRRRNAPRRCLASIRRPSTPQPRDATRFESCRCATSLPRRSMRST